MTDKVKLAVTRGGCSHSKTIPLEGVTPSKLYSEGCEDCLKMREQGKDAWWVHLRLCMECGHVGCCDSSPNTHATKHYQSVGHPIMRSYEPGESWGWCYADQRRL